MRDPARTTDSHMDPESETIPKIIMLLFVGAFTIGGLIGYVTRGFGFFSQSTTVRSKPATSQPAAPSRRAQQVRSIIAPKPMAVPSPTRRPAPAKVSQPTPAPAPTKISRPAPAPVAQATPDYAPSRTTQPAAAAESTVPVFRVQVGAFRSRGNAETLVKKLQEDGFLPYINFVAGVHRVRIGPFSNRAEADRLVEALRAKDYNVFVTR